MAISFSPRRIDCNAIQPTTSATPACTAKEAAHVQTGASEERTVEAPTPNDARGISRGILTLRMSQNGALGQALVDLRERVPDDKHHPA